MDAALTRLLDFVALDAGAFAICVLGVFVAGLVRGFSGFALAATVMASLATILPPVELIPVNTFLELVAGLILVRGGIGEANRKVVWGLVIGTALGTPLGLWATVAIEPATSRVIALGLVAVLAALQLFRVRAAVLATRPGLYLAGLCAGVASGLASIGGMIVALYVLAQDAPPREMRASLIMFLLYSMPVQFILLTAYGLIDERSLARAAVFCVPIIAGVSIGRLFFRPSLEVFYKRFCLALLIGLALAGLARLALPAAV